MHVCFVNTGSVLPPASRLSFPTSANKDAHHRANASQALVVKKCINIIFSENY